MSWPWPPTCGTWSRFLDDPLLGRHNVVHTPHNAGRTREANLAWTENLAIQFDPPEA